MLHCQFRMISPKKMKTSFEFSRKLFEDVIRKHEPLSRNVMVSQSPAMVAGGVSTPSKEPDPPGRNVTPSPVTAAGVERAEQGDGPARPQLLAVSGGWPVERGRRVDRDGGLAGWRWVGRRAAWSRMP